MELSESQRCWMTSPCLSLQMLFLPHSFLYTWSSYIDLLLFFSIWTLYLLFSQRRCCPLLPIFPWLSLLIWVSRSVPWPACPLTAQSLFSFLHSTQLMLFQKQGSWGNQRFWSYLNPAENLQKLDLMDWGRLSSLTALSTILSRIGTMPSLTEEKESLK